MLRTISVPAVRANCLKALDPVICSTMDFSWRWRLLDRVFRPSFDDINTFVPADKPRMIAETSTNERGDDPGKKAAWICDAYGRAMPEALPEVKAVMWFDEPTNEGGWIVPWPIDSSEQSAAAFRAAVAPPYYVGSLGDAPIKLGRQKVPPP